jgi:6-phosphogluconolactonase
MIAVALAHSRRRLLLAAVATLVVIAGPAAANAMASAGAVYTQTNNPAGNTVQKFDRYADGSLSPAGTFATGGNGLAGLGGRQGAVELSDDEAYVYAVNAGSDSVTVFRVTDAGLEVSGTVGSGGVAPASIDEREGIVYVLNSGGTPNVSTFTQTAGGSLAPLTGGQRDLSAGATGAAQVSVAPDGSTLVVSERTAHRLETLALDGAGRPGAPVVTAANGLTPFGFAFGHRGDVLVSEAGSSAISSYRVGADGALGTITGSAPVGQGGVCWVAASPNGRLAYTGNASGSISGFSVGEDGSLSALDADGLGVTLPATTPRDLDFARNGRFLYAVSPAGRVIGFRVEADGSLTQVGSAPAAAGITGAAAA